MHTHHQVPPESGTVFSKLPILARSFIEPGTHGKQNLMFTST